jgi:hypothetical protein
VRVAPHYDPVAAFDARVSIVPITGCWLWLGEIKPNGYPTHWVDKRHVHAHRFSYERYRGKLAPKLVIDHLCRNRWCVNPDHMEEVTQRVNVLRGIGIPAVNAKKTHCKQGHLLAGDNLISKGGTRICRTCKNEWQRAGWRRRAQVKLAATEPKHLRWIAPPGVWP